MKYKILGILGIILLLIASGIGISIAVVLIKFVFTKMTFIKLIVNVIIRVIIGYIIGLAGWLILKYSGNNIK